MERYEHSRKDYKDYVLENLKVGEWIIARSDTYTSDQDRGNKAAKKVVGMYANFLRTLDDYGRPETFDYFEVYNILRSGGKLSEEEKKLRDLRNHIYPEE